MINTLQEQTLFTASMDLPPPNYKIKKWCTNTKMFLTLRYTNPHFQSNFHGENKNVL